MKDFNIYDHLTDSEARILTNFFNSPLAKPAFIDMEKENTLVRIIAKALILITEDVVKKHILVNIVEKLENNSVECGRIFILDSINYTLLRSHLFPNEHREEKPIAKQVGRISDETLLRESKTYTLDELQSRIIVWARERGIFHKATAQTQLLKAFEEMGELAKALLKNDQEELEDAIGDVFVCLVNLAHFKNTTVRDCVNSAYQEIRGRKGKMVNGTFVKDIS